MESPTDGRTDVKVDGRRDRSAHTYKAFGLGSLASIAKSVAPERRPPRLHPGGLFTSFMDDGREKRAVVSRR